LPNDETSELLQVEEEGGPAGGNGGGAIVTAAHDIVDMT
jgi:hypothetical protein